MTFTSKSDYLLSGVYRKNKNAHQLLLSSHLWQTPAVMSGCHLTACVCNSAGSWRYFLKRAAVGVQRGGGPSPDSVLTAVDTPISSHALWCCAFNRLLGEFFTVLINCLLMLCPGRASLRPWQWLRASPAVTLLQDAKAHYWCWGHNSSAA